MLPNWQGLWSGPPCPHRRAFIDLPLSVRRTLWDYGFSRIQADGEVLLEFVKDVELLEDLVSSLQSRCLLEAPQAREILSSLVAMVPPGKPSHDYLPWQIEWALQGRSEEKLGAVKEIEEIVIKKWRHWKPGRTRPCPLTSIQEIELDLRDKWAARLISSILPVSEHLSMVKPLMSSKDPVKEIKHLLGATRFRTIRIHCLGLKELNKLGVPLPWKEEHIRDLLNKLIEMETSASRLSRLWRTLSWVGKKFGALRPETVERLLKKKEFAVDSLVSSAISPQKQAAVPSLQLVQALEIGLACQGLPWPSRFILGVARFTLGCSARFNDFQHCRPSDVHLTTNTIEVMAWQTKTSSLQGGKRKPSPLIAPQWCFSSCAEPWWETVLKMFQRFSSHPSLQEMDYLIPTIDQSWLSWNYSKTFLLLSSASLA